ncbi:MAG: Ger(x)C family spore germination protein [Clostridia bacterium]|nr:Ger(x)C family spore germination protein [Clostridia bacterium]
MKKIIPGLLLFIILPFFLTSCWDIRDINNRAFVAAIGLDLPEDPTQKYQVTFQFWDPIKILRKNETNTITEKVEAQSINQAVELMQARLSKTITFTHLQLLLVGEDLARTKNFQDLANFFLKNSEIALKLRLNFIQGKTAYETLKSQPKLGKNITDKLIDMSQLEKKFSLPRTSAFYYFLSDLRKTEGTALGSRIVLPGEFLIRNGGAVFGDWKLKGFLSAEEAQAANWLVEDTQAIVVGSTPEGTYTYHSKISRLNMEITEMPNGLPKFTVNLKLIGSIVEEEGKHLDLSQSENIEKMEILFSQVIAEQVKNAIHKSQKEFGIDYLGFGKVLKEKRPKIYENIDWQKQFPHIPIEVSVKAQVKRFGLIK